MADLNESDQPSHAEEDGRSELSSELQHSCMEDREHLQVYLRIRPLTSAESSRGEAQDCVTMETPDTVLLKPPSLSLLARLSSDKSLPETGQCFQFSKVYGPETAQGELFDGTVKDLVRDVLEGGDSLVFTYGVTNSGKTFTFLGPDSDAGILPRSLQLIFSSVQENVFHGASVKPHRCREFVALSREQQAEEALFKRNLLRQLRENEKCSSSSQSLLEGSTLTGPGAAAEEGIGPEVKANAKFSVWVSFCEIYNENIHDLLEVTPSGAPRRAALRLSQDARGNAFVKDLRWVQVSSVEEAYRVVKLGRRNQSFSSTRLNQLSSRSHSIFSVRILSVEAGDPPRVLSISELCLCDLAGSERCAKTQNQGERLKEAGNINASLLILGKCIKALRYKQRAKLLQHIPFRESKLTRYLQGFFCGRGKACMIVNINQCASMYDETLNVLKFSAVAQKVAVLVSRPLPFIPTTGRKTLMSSSSLTGCEISQDDVQDDEEEEESSLMEVDGEEGDENDKIILSKRMHERQVALLKQLQVQLKKERADNLLLEARVREETSREFSQLFSDMQKDYDERLAREKEILEERAERRLEIFKNLTEKMSSAGSSSDQPAVDALPISERPSPLCLGSGQAEAPQNCENEADEEGRRLPQLQGRSQQPADLQKKAELGSQSGSGRDDGRSSHGDQLREALAELDKEKTKREEMLAALEYQTLGKEEALASLQQERRAREEATAALQELRQHKEELLTSLEVERREAGRLAQELQKQDGGQPADALEPPALRRHPAAAELEEKSREILDQSCQIHILTQELQRLKQELQAAADSAESVSNQLRGEASELRRSLDEERTANETKQKRILERERELQEATHKLLLSDQQGEQLTGRLKRAEEEVEELKKKLQQLEEAEQTLREQQQEAAEKLRKDLEEAQLNDVAASSRAAELQGTNSDLQREISSLREKLSSLEATEAVSSELEEKLARTEKTSAHREAELQEKLQEAERRVGALQKRLQEAEERRQEEELQAVQEARRREAERRRELLAVAHEAIAEKEAELEKKAEEISRLKENAQQEAEKVKNLSLELQRKEDDSSDLREKLADYKKQIQQVQTEISAMREEEKVLKQKLADVDKAKKQLQSDLSSRDRTIQQLRAEQADTKSESSLQLYQKACKELEAKQRVMEDMRLALSEQEETQEQMEQVLEEKMGLLQELSAEVERLKGKLLQQNHDAALHGDHGPSEDLRLARDEASQAQESLKTFTEKHQAERRKWQEEKLSLIGQAKEAEDRRNQEMKKFAEDRERYCRQQSVLESKLEEKDQSMESWRKERDALVAALEVQLQKLLSSQAEKDKVIKELREQSTERPPEVNDGAGSPRVAELQAALTEREAEILRLKKDLEASRGNQTEQNVSPAEKPICETTTTNPGRRETRASASSRGSSGFPSVLESSEISTENGRTSRFPRPELEISFSPLQPNRVALRRQGEEGAVTVKITRSARKRKSGEMEKEEVESENRRNTKTKVTPKLTPQKDERSPSARRHDSQSSRRDGTLQKIGDFLQCSPTLLGSKAKKMMSLVSGRLDADSAAASSSSLSLKAKRGRKKLYRPEISCPMEMPPHPIINQEADESESDHQIIKRRLRSRVAKC